MYSRKSRCLIILIISNFTCLVFAHTKSPIVCTDDGIVQGTIWMTRKNVTFFSFLNIPYAEPPVGDLRFQDPLPKAKWTGIRNASEWGPICMQTPTVDTEGFPMSEDCLQLNVFTKSLNRKSLLPVIIFIHGGTFERGAARNHHPHLMMDRDVVLVTINFRSGPLGLLATGSEEAPGNAGLKDQVMAIQWVSDNIKRFGGNPNKITLAGFSSGGVAATIHMVSEMTRKVGIHRVMAMSGTIGVFPSLKYDNLPLANSLAAQLSCPTDTVAEMVDCLRTKKAEDIVKVDVTGAIKCKYGATWQPVIERDFGQDRFLSRNPFEVFDSRSRRKNYARIPVITGFTEHEYYHFIQILQLDTKFSEAWLADFNSFSAECFNFERFSKTSTLFKSFYLPFGTFITPDPRSIGSTGNLISDGIINYGTNRFVDKISNLMDVYYYKFSYLGSHSINPTKPSPIVLHVDDLQYVLNTKFIGPTIKLSDPENFMVERMTKIWENFAKTGNPNNPNDPELNNVWPKYDLENEYYVDIGEKLVQKKSVFQDRFNAMDDLRGN